MKSEYWVLRGPPCPHCGSEIPVPEVQFAQPTVAGACPRCGKPVSFSPLPPEIKQAIAPGKPHLVATHVAFQETDLSAPGAARPLQPQDTKPVVFQCPQCSASLPVTAESKRTIVCRYCQSSVYLPDGLWKQLHPVKTAQTWSAVFRIDPKQMRQDIKQNALLLMTGLGFFGVGVPALLTLLGVLTVTGVISAKGGPQGGYPLMVFALLLFLGWVIGCVLIWVRSRADLGLADQLDALDSPGAHRIKSSVSELAEPRV